MSNHVSILGLSWLGKCFDMLELDPLELTSSNKIGKNVIILPEPEAEGEIPKGLKTPENTFLTHVLVTEELIYNSHDYRSKIRQTLGASVGFLDIFEFSASASNEEAENKTASREEVMKYALIVRERQRLQLDLENPKDLQPHLDRDFQKAVEDLPSTEGTNQDTNPYQDFIRKYGTHFASTLTLGGLAYQEVRVSTEEISSGKLKAQDFETSATVTIEGFKAGMEASVALEEARKQDQKAKIERSKITFSGGKGGLELFSQWIAEADEEPVPIMKRSVFSRLPELFNSSFFPDDADIDNKRELLEDAIDEYLVIEGGKKGKYLHYGEPCHLYHQHKNNPSPFVYAYVKDGNILKLRGISRLYPSNVNVRHRPNPVATLSFEPVAQTDYPGTIIYAGEHHPVRVKVKEANGYLEINLKNPPIEGYKGSNNLVTITPRSDLATTILNIGIYTPANINEKPRPLTTGDKIFIYHWDEKTKQYYALVNGNTTISPDDEPTEVNLHFTSVGSSLPTLTDVLAYKFKLFTLQIDHSSGDGTIVEG